MTSIVSGRNEHTRMTLTFSFGILEVKDIDDIGQSLSVPMYLSVAWPERRMWINDTHYAWRENVTGPVNVSYARHARSFPTCKMLRNVLSNVISY